MPQNKHMKVILSLLSVIILWGLLGYISGIFSLIVLPIWVWCVLYFRDTIAHNMLRVKAYFMMARCLFVKQATLPKGVNKLTLKGILIHQKKERKRIQEEIFQDLVEKRDRKNNPQPIVRPMTCQAVQYFDQMHCSACQLKWDMNDIDAPECVVTGYV